MKKLEGPLKSTSHKVNALSHNVKEEEERILDLPASSNLLQN